MLSTDATAAVFSWCAGAEALYSETPDQFKADAWRCRHSAALAQQGPASSGAVATIVAAECVTLPDRVSARWEVYELCVAPTLLGPTTSPLPMRPYVAHP